MSRADDVVYQGFRALHVAGTPLVLVNVWDAASARLVQAAGAPAVATTSAGVSWSLGVPDGEALDRATMLAAVRRIGNVVSVPITADIEGGYGDPARSAADFVDAGVAGINIEDSWHGHAEPLRDLDDQAGRIAAVRAAAGAGLFINARIDTYLAGPGDLTDTLARAAAYVEAGADGVFVPGLTDLDTVAALIAKVGAPVNVMAGPGAPSVAEFASVGVARVSLGASVAAAAYGVASRAATEAFTAGTYKEVEGAADFAVLQRN